ncbi:sugar transferase [Williamsia maris]|uniref:Exopolysaccharide biosynthesis polyprenyl glycosylphosphotransferase n=1 Tax=Williamsia maris TaxID=72806 RepID=A0ABT1HFL7_9NOCA|nr:sugar transferase [Williamsia maris]MCP2176525.1 exopolysaccharide biosynthesis polyprenyl glycosylphosphotransferase [Williamsia maris]
MLLLLDLIAVAAAIVYATDQRWQVLESIAFVCILGTGGLYRSRITLSALLVLPRLVGFSMIATLALVIVFDAATPLQRAVAEALAVAAMLFVIRVFYFGVQRARRRRITTRTRTAIIGGGKVAYKLMQSAGEQRALGLDVMVVVDDNPFPEILDSGVAVDSSRRPIREIVEEYGIETVIVAYSRTADSNFVSPLRECDDLECEIFVVPRLFEFVHASSDMDRIHTIPLIHVRRLAQRTWYWHAKRAFDIVMAAFAILLVAPVLAATALAVFLTDPKAPIIFRQERIGREGRPFDLYKFRSMRPVPATASDVDWAPDRANRVGPVGKFIRKTSIDELPQLWNVARGDMSIVGPRPERPHFVAQFQGSVPSYQDRHRLNVGLTGWAAINGLRGDTSIDDRAVYDNYYIANWSVWLDIKIIILTFGALLRGTGY